MTLHVRNWQKFQHYKDRGPVWIKLYVELLDNPDFLALPDAAKGQLCALYLLAAKRSNTLPDKPSTLRALIGCTGKLWLEELIAGGWLTRSEDASRSASIGDSKPASTNASPSRASAPSREEETETETEQSSATTARTRVTFLAAMPETIRAGWSATLDAWQEGLGAPGGKPLTGEQIDAGLAEYLASEAAPTFSPRHVVRFVEGVAKRLPRISAPATAMSRVRTADLIPEELCDADA